MRYSRGGRGAGDRAGGRAGVWLQPDPGEVKTPLGLSLPSIVGPEVRPTAERLTVGPRAIEVQPRKLTPCWAFQQRVLNAGN